MEAKTLYRADGSPVEKHELVKIPLIAALMLCLLCSLFTAFVAPTSKPKPASTISSGDTTAIVSSGTSGVITFSGVSPETWVKQQDAAEKAKENTWKHRPHLQAPADAPPSAIRVGPYLYTVNYTTKAALDTQNAYALTDTEVREIWLDPHRTASLRGDLLHELLHCARDLGTGGGRFFGMHDGEENAIEGVSDGLLQVLQDNPELMAWMERK